MDSAKRRKKSSKDEAPAASNGASASNTTEYVQVPVNEVLLAQVHYRNIQFRASLTPQQYVEWLLRNELAKIKREIDERRGY